MVPKNLFVFKMLTCRLLQQHSIEDMVGGPAGQIDV